MTTTDQAETYLKPKTRTKDRQIHAAVTTEAGHMLDALGALRGQTMSYALEQLIRDTCYGKTLTAKERKDLWALIEKDQPR